jgi:hypothetical protein
MYSLDGGVTWTNPSTDLWVSFDSNVGFDSLGHLYWQGLAFLPAGNRGIVIAQSIDKGQTFPESLTSWAVNDPNGNADQGYMAIDTQPGSPFQDNIYVVWSDYPSTPYPGQRGFALLFTRSTDHGATFSMPIDISDSLGCGQEHSSHIATGPNGEIYVAWIGGCSNAVRFVKSLDGGLTWSSDAVVREYPAPVNSFALTDDVRGNITVAVDRSHGPFHGYIYVSSIDTNGPSGGAADAWVVRSTDGGTTWSNSVLLSDGPRGAYKYYFQPRIAVASDGRIDAAWYDTRHNTSTDTNNVTYDVFYTFSADGGGDVSTECQGHRYVVRQGHPVRVSRAMRGARAF